MMYIVRTTRRLCVCVCVCGYMCVKTPLARVSHVDLRKRARITV